MCDGGCECGDAGVSATRRESAYDMIRVQEAVRRVLGVAGPLPVERVAARKAKGLVLAEPVRSSEPLPPFRASIMDGYAVVAADGVGTFPVVERIAAGGLPAGPLQPGHVAYITTGSPVPDGADAVVKIEDTSGVDGDEHSASVDEKAVNILKAVKTGQNIRPIGSDIQPGELLVDAHELITAAEIGLLATVGITEVKAHRRPVIGVLSTGSELVEAFAEATPQGKIRDSNRPMLLSLLEDWGVEMVDLGVCSDKKDELRKTLKDAFEKVDILITSGGVSMGEHDLIKPLLEELGTVHFGRLFMKPGKPTTFATVKDSQGNTKLAFALPGNPVSTFTTCHLLVRPAIKRLRGFPEEKCHLTQVHAVLTHPVKLDLERPEFHRATVEWDSQKQQFIATSTGIQMSSRLLSCRNANALLSLPTGTEIRDGDAVEAFLLDDSIPNGSNGNSSQTAPRSAPVAKHHSSAAAPAASNLKTFRAGLVTISDSVSAGKTTDLSGPAMVNLLKNYPKAHMEVVATKVVPDDLEQIQAVIMEWADSDAVDLILTSGGTGFSPRDVTPEAVKAVLDKEIPGFVMVMLQNSLRFTPKGILSRPVAGIRKQSLIVTLPGKPKAVAENFSALEDVLPHALLLVRDVPHDHHRADPSSRYT